MDFHIPFKKLTKFDEVGLSRLNQDLEYIEKTLQRYPRQVTYSTDMDTDVAGVEGEIAYCATDNIFYGCVSTGPAGSASWKAFHA